jgi:predicted DNA-binding protein with PD1-like motif
MSALKVYIPQGNWVVATLSAYCFKYGIGNAAISAIGSITDIWVLVHPAEEPVVRNWPAGTSYEMTALTGNIALRQGRPEFDPAGLATGQYPQFDTSVPALNPYIHVHVTFADGDMSIWGGHLLDAMVSIGAEIFLLPTAAAACEPGLMGPPPADCVTSVPVTAPPYGTFSNWDQRFWFPPQS